MPACQDSTSIRKCCKPGRSEPGIHSLHEGDWQGRRRSNLQDDELGEAQAVEEGAHNKLVVVGDAVVGQVLAAVQQRDGPPGLLVMQIAHPPPRHAAGEFRHRCVGMGPVLRDEDRELDPAKGLVLQLSHSAEKVPE